MQRLEVSCAVRPIYGSLGVKRLRNSNVQVNYILLIKGQYVCSTGVLISP